MNELIVIDAGTAMLIPETSERLYMLETSIKNLEKAHKVIKEAIQEEMERKGIVKLVTDELSIRYLAPTNKESFDSKEFRKDNPEVYDSYVKLSPVKASIRITLK